MNKSKVRWLKWNLKKLRQSVLHFTQFIMRQFGSTLHLVSCVFPFYFILFYFIFFTHFPPQAATVHHCSWIVAATFDQAFREPCIRALFTDPQISFFSNFFIKNGSHGTIHIFKNYFITVFLVFSFQFQQNKFYPNGPYLYCIGDWYRLKFPFVWGLALLGSHFVKHNSSFCISNVAKNKFICRLSLRFRK